MPRKRCVSSPNKSKFSRKIFFDPCSVANSSVLFFGRTQRWFRVAKTALKRRMVVTVQIISNSGRGYFTIFLLRTHILVLRSSLEIPNASCQSQDYLEVLEVLFLPGCFSNQVEWVHNMLVGVEVDFGY